MTKLIANYLSFSLRNVGDRFEQFLFLYLVYGLLIGLVTFTSLNILGILRGYPVIQAFQGMYSWHTTLNFSLCFIGATQIFQLIKHSKEGQVTWKVSHLWLLGTGSFALAYLLQRTVVYAGVEEYNPTLIEYYNNYPGTRPSFVAMLGWCLLFWIPTFFLLVQIAIWKEKRNERYMSGAAEPGLRRWSLEGGKILLNIDDITHISMEDHYAKIYLRRPGGDTEKLVRLTLKEAVKQLPGDRFIQVHRSHLINLDHVEGLIREKQKWLVKIAGRKLPISRSRLTVVRAKITGEG